MVSYVMISSSEFNLEGIIPELKRGTEEADYHMENTLWKTELKGM